MIEEAIKLLIYFRLLDTKDLLTLACLNSAFRTAINKPSIWRMMAHNKAYPHESVPNKNIKYRFLNTEILENHLAEQEKIMKSLEPISRDCNEITFLSGVGAGISCFAGMGLDLIGACYSFTGCCGAAPPCQFCITLYPTCYSTTTTITASTAVGHVLMWTIPPSAVLACALVACTAKQINVARKNSELKARRTSIIEKIETLKNLIKTHGLFENPKRLIMSDEEILPLAEKATETTALLRKI